MKNLKEPHASLYEPAVTVKWMKGRRPELVIFDSGIETERIKLEKMKTEEIHQLMAEKGFVKNLEDCTEEGGETTCAAGVVPPVVNVVPNVEVSSD